MARFSSEGCRKKLLNLWIQQKKCLLPCPCVSKQTLINIIIDFHQQFEQCSLLNMASDHQINACLAARYSAAWSSTVYSGQK